ncbi:MAG: filamentous hemagglutinin family protein [Methyloglobulus sp.]
MTLAKGSTVDVAGGGDLLAYEFQKGLSGDNDYLQLADDQISYGRNGGFAILPSLGSALAPYDPFQSASFTEGVGSQIYLSGTDKLAAGFYTLLPSHYALLPGAFLVTPQNNTQDQRTTTYDQAGIPTVAGYRSLAGTGARDARWSGFLLENGVDIRKNSKYDEQTANSFFARAAVTKETSVPLLPNDSGQIIIKDVQTKLALEGDIKSASSGGKGARLDISANRLKIVKALSASPIVGEVELLADNLTNLHVGSLLLGGERSINPTSKATEVNITAEQVSFESNAQVHVTDLAAAATGQVIVKNNATLIADGIVNTGDKQFNIKGDGALLRVSADKQITLSRTGSQGATGDLLIEKGAKLSASKSMLLDGSHTSELAGDILMKSGSLYLGGNAMNIGEVNGLSAAGAINLSNDRLASLTVDELLLNSQTGINFYGDVGKRDSAGLLQPLSFKRLVMNSPELSGYGSAKQTVNIKADNLLVQNTSGTDVIGHGSGVGKLAITAENYSQGSGNVGINGFNSAAITVAKGFTAVGNGSLIVDADLFLTSGYLTANGGNVLDINAVGHQLQMTQIANAIIPDITSYGGVIKVTADSINFNARALLPSGTLALYSLKGSLLVGPQADIDLAGRKVGFADTYAYTPGGKFNATADLGKITLAENSSINADTGGGKAVGGKLFFAAPKQNVEILKGAKLSAKTGSATFDVGGFNANSSFDNLMDTLLIAGVTDSISLRSRQADIVQQFGHSITANQINLASDQGAISLAGKLVADGEKGGSVKLFAGDSITLQSGAVVSAKSTGANAKGGDVLLSSTNSDLLDKLSGIRINKDALIDVSGSAKDNGGKVILRALRKGSDDIDINPIAGTVKGFSGFYGDAVRKYDNSNFSVQGQILTANINDIKKDTDDYMTAATLLKVSNRLGSGIRLRPGVEIDYKGDLNLKDLWDLNEWKYADASGKPDVAGVLTIKATGNLSFENALTDGFVRGNTSTGEVKDILQSNDSWSYQLTAGADLASANATTVVAAGAGEGKNITLATNTAASTDPSIVNTVIRTGTGDIELAASGNLVFGDKTSLYNAGKASATNPYGTLGDTFTNATDFTQPQYYGGDYSQAGGDLVINVGRDIKGALSQNVFFDPVGYQVPNWLRIQGNNWADPLLPYPKEASAWAVDFIKFDQNVGSFGGGKVVINAGHDINDLAVMMPTTGKQVGEKSVSADGVTTWLTNKLQINGGGELRVNAEGNVAGGVYYLAQGKGSIHADGAVTGSNAPNASVFDEFFVFRRTVLGLVDGPQLLQGGNAQLFVDAAKAVNVNAPTDPLVLGGADHGHSFYSYGPDSSLSLSSLAEDIKLSGVSVALLGEDLRSNNYYQYSPASLFATAFGGNFRMGGGATMTLFPSQRGQLSILAKQNIDSQFDATAPASGAITMLDYDPNSLPNAYAIGGSATLENKSIHAGDAEPVRLITQQGDIRDLALTLRKKAIISSGHDLVNVSVNTEHANPSGDTTVIAAARDITYPTLRDKNTGVLDLGSGDAIRVAGQGNVLVQAGRNIDLGSKDGIVTVGNAGGTYKNLLKTGANITVMAGLNGGVANYLGVSKLNQDVLKYAGNFNKVQQLVTDFMRNRTGNTKLTTKAAYDQFKKLNEAEYPALKKQLDALRSNQYTDVIANIKAEIVGFVRQLTNNNALTETQALQAFAKLKPDQYLAIQPKLNTLTNQILFSELNQTGTASAGDPTAGNVRGFDAIAALYPGNAWKGDINLVFSNIKTTAGGNIDLIAPGGGINVGLASPPSGLNKTSDILGIIANQEGNINAFVKDNIAVNESRVFALGGGNIMLWSSGGDIDAGRGAKSAISIPPPVFGFDNDGNLVVEFPNPSSGSGIRTAKPIYSAGKQGDVGLFAPGGVVDAGEAGIGGNNVTISATSVLGANNIQVGGVSTGVPAASTGSVVAGLTGVSNLSASVSQMAQASADLGKDDDKKKNKKLGRINVELIGFGA